METRETDETQATPFTAALGQRYETVFCVFLAALVILLRDNAHVEFPHVPLFIAAMLGLNLAAGVALRTGPASRELSALVTLANVAVVTAILDRSGGAESNLWILYLLPVYTSCLLLETRHVALVTAGAAAANAVFLAVRTQLWGADDTFALALKTAVLVFAAAVTRALAVRERRVSRDLQERCRRLRESDSRLRAAMAAGERSRGLAELGMTVSGVAHDLRSPLTVLTGMIELVRSQPELTPETRELLASMERSTRLLSRITEEVLDLGRGGAGRRETLRLAAVVEETLRLYGPELLRAGVRVRREFDADGPRVCGDAAALKRVLLNLFTNARQAMPEGGELAVGIETRTPGVARLTVEDTGAGIPAGVLARIFDGFTTTKAGGHGIGLASAKRLAEAHGGTLRAENRPEGGARFTLLLPASERLPAAAGAEGPAAQPALRPLTA